MAVDCPGHVKMKNPKSIEEVEDDNDEDDEETDDEIGMGVLQTAASLDLSDDCP